MRTTVDLLDAFKTARGIESDYAAAKALGVTKQSVSRYRRGDDTLGPDVALRVAHELRLDPGYVLACMAAERAQSEALRVAWETVAQRLAGAAAALLVAFFATLPASPAAIARAPAGPVSPSDTGADRLCIMTNRRRRKSAAPDPALRLAAYVSKMRTPLCL